MQPKAGSLHPGLVCTCTQFTKVECLLRHMSFYCFQNLPLGFSSPKGLLTQVYLFGLQAIFDQMAYFFIFLPSTILLFCKVFQGCPFPTFATCSDGHVMSLFSLLVLLPHSHDLIPKEPLHPLLIIGKDFQGLVLKTLPPSVSVLHQQTIWHQPCFLSGLQESHEKYLLLLPSPCHAPDPPQSWLNAGSFPDALRCQDFEAVTRSQKTLALETYSYSPERKDSLSKPHPFTATQFPFFVSWLKPMSFFFFSVAWYLVPCCCPKLPPQPPAVPALHLLGTSDTTILNVLWKNPAQHYWGHWDSRWCWGEQIGHHADLPQLMGPHIYRTVGIISRKWKLLGKTRNADLQRQNKGSSKEECL